MDFNGLDLNLLVAFDALMRERHVSRAAVRVGVSQPAMSAALARLRKHFSDVLFRRTGDGLMPTPRASELAETIGPVLIELGSLLIQTPEFDAQAATRTFSLGLSDYPAFVLLPELLAELERSAPNVSLRVHSFTNRDQAVDLLDSGTIDLAIGVPPTQQESRILTRPILTDEFITLLRKDNPVALRNLDLEAFLTLNHVLVSPEGDNHGLVDQVLASQGLKRRLGLTLPQMFTVPEIISQTDMAATLLSRVALYAASRNQLQMFMPPVSLPIMEFHLIWHRHNDNHSAQRWLRDTIEAVATRV